MATANPPSRSAAAAALVAAVVAALAAVVRVTDHGALAVTAVFVAGAQIAAGVRPYPFLHIDREKIWARADPR